MRILTLSLILIFSYSAKADIDYCNSLYDEFNEFYQYSQSAYLKANLIWLNDGGEITKARDFVRDNQSCNPKWVEVEWKKAGEIYLLLRQAESDSEGAKDSLSELKRNCSESLDEDSLDMERNLNNISSKSNEMLSSKFLKPQGMEKDHSLSILAEFCGFWPIY